MDSLFSSILTASFHGSIVIAAVALLRLVLRKAPKKYICYLWLLAGLRQLMPFQIQSDLSLQPAAPPQTAILWEQPKPGQAAAPEAGEEAAVPRLLPLVWVGMAAVFLGSSLWSYRSLRRRVRDARPIPGGWEADNIETAFILGFVRPRIYIPTGMSDSARGHILAHERTHLDKGDHWIKMVGYLALCLHWFNPLVWLAYGLLCKDIEMACDERVVQFMELPERKDYSAALLSCSTGRIRYAASPVAFGEISVKSRILSILNYRKPSFWMGLASFLAIVFVAVCLVTSPTQEAQSQARTQDNTRYLEPAQSPEATDPGWGVELVAEPLSASAMKLYYSVETLDTLQGRGDGMYKNDAYWLQRWNGEDWEYLEILASDPTYEGSGAREFSLEASGVYYADTLDWSLIYGQLPQGDYRIGVRFTRNGKTKPHYANFHIFANTLTGAEAAVTRCETALDKLLEGPYTCTVRQTNAFGQLMPVMRLRSNTAEARVELYYGDICYDTETWNLGSPAVSAWDDAFRPRGNKFLSFPQGDSWIRDDEIRFLSVWTDRDGISYRQYNTYTFGENGCLTGAERLTQWQDGEGAQHQSRRSFTLDGLSWGDWEAEPEPEDSWDASRNSPWRIFFRVDDDLLTASGGEVWMALENTVGLSDYTADGSYWLERWSETGWQTLPARGEPSWGEESYRLKSATDICYVDWTPYYGQLEAGLYRMGKHFYKGDDAIIQYAQFAVEFPGGVAGEGGEEAIARIDEAVEALCRGNYHIARLDSRGALTGTPRLSQAYWKYGDVCLTGDYSHGQTGGSFHCQVITGEDPQADQLCHVWRRYLNWHDPNTLVMFPQGASLISPERIVFATTNAGNSPDMTCYDIRFDQDGAITSIRFSTGVWYEEDRNETILQVEQTPEQEIRAWVEQHPSA